MKIENTSINLINLDTQATDAKNKELAKSVVTPELAAQEPATRGDSVQLSDRSRMVAKAQELATNAPDVRQAKVDELRNSIQAGTYQVNGRMVADSMLRKSITEV